MLSSIRRFFRRLLRTERADADMAREMNSHLQLLEDEFVRKGMSRIDARYEARRAFGGVEQAKELQRDARSFRWMAGWSMDVRLGVRMLVKSPGLTVIAVIALAVAIGAGAAYFEFVNDFFRPSLPIPGGDRLVGIATVDIQKNLSERRTSYELIRWQQQLKSLTDVGGASAIDRTLATDDGRNEGIRAAAISAAVFGAVPIPPLHGRTLNADDERPGAPDVAVIGEEVWADRFSRDPNVVGRTVRLGDTPHTVVGVMPEAFAFPINQQVWVPLRLNESGLTRGEGPPLQVFGRLAPGATLATAQLELSTIEARLPDAAAHPHRRSEVKPYVESLWSTPNLGWQVKVLYLVNLLFIALLGICGSNVATLVFARTITREGEITVRTALGASRARIVSQLVAEALVLAGIAAGLGLIGATLILRTVREIWTAAQNLPLPFWWNEQIGVDTVLYTVLLVVLAALLVGGVPALKATGPQMQRRLKAAGSSGATLNFGRLWTGIIVVQVAFTVLLLLMTASLAWTGIVLNRRFADVALPREEFLSALVVIRDDVPRENQIAGLHEVERRVREHPGVMGVTYATKLPGLGQGEFWLEFPPEDAALQAAAAEKSSNDVLWVRTSRVGAGYFETFGQRLVAGRLFTASEIEAARNVVVVDESFARTVLGGRSAVGRMVREAPRQPDDKPGPWVEIIGVVTDISTVKTDKAEDAMLYQPLGPGSTFERRIVVHARPDAAAFEAPLRAAVAAANPDFRLREVWRLDAAAEVESRTFGYFVAGIGVIGVVALLLSTGGIYALISFTLARRTREIGIRMALGAAPHRLVAAILSRAFWQIGAGIALGAIPGLFVVIPGLEDDAGPLGLGSAALLVLSVSVFVIATAALSCASPLRKALKTDPTVALRADG